MKIVTWNIRLGLQEGLDAIVAHLSPLDAEIIALQEVGRHWWMGPRGDTTQTLARALNRHGFFVPCIRGAGGAEYGHALLTRGPLVRPRLVDLPQDTDEPRRLLDTGVHTEAGQVRVLSTHLSHVADRDAQGVVVSQRFARADSAALLLGDLNTESAPWLGAIQRVAAQTPHVPTYPADAPTQRIDYIFGHGVVFGEAQVVDTGSASDHRLVVVDVNLLLS